MKNFVLAFLCVLALTSCEALMNILNQDAIYPGTDTHVEPAQDTSTAQDTYASPDSTHTGGTVLKAKALGAIQIEDGYDSAVGMNRHEFIKQELKRAQTILSDLSDGKYQVTFDYIFLPDTPLMDDEMGNVNGFCMPNQSQRLKQYFIDAGYDINDYVAFFRLFNGSEVSGMTARDGTTCTKFQGGMAFASGNDWGMNWGNGCAAITIDWWSFSPGSKYEEAIAPYLVHEYIHIIDFQFEYLGETRFINIDTRTQYHASCINTSESSDDSLWRHSIMTTFESADETSCSPVEWTQLDGKYGHMD